MIKGMRVPPTALRTEERWGADMITDPELDGEWRTEPSEEPAEPLAPRGRERERAAGGARPWLWALGGVVVASAVWAGGLYAFGDRLGEPTVSYRATKNLCEDFTAKALTGIAGEMHENRPVNKQDSHPAVDAAVCVLENGGDGVEDFTVWARVDLHKKTDPSAEFDVPSLLTVARMGDVRREAVPGLGERAVMMASAGERELALKVLDGGAVFTVQAFAPTFEEKNGRPATDATAVQAALIADTRALLDALEK